VEAYAIHLMPFSLIISVAVNNVEGTESISSIHKNVLCGIMILLTVPVLVIIVIVIIADTLPSVL